MSIALIDADIRRMGAGAMLESTGSHGDGVDMIEPDIILIAELFYHWFVCMQTFITLIVLISVLSYYKVGMCDYLILAIPTSLLHDQFSFRLTSSTTCTLNYLVHHATDMLQRCD